MEVSVLIIIAGALGIGSYVFDFLIGQRKCRQKMQNRFEGSIEARNSLQKSFTAACSWLLLERKGITIVPFFRDYFPGNIAIYGYGKLGRLLYQELECEGISLSFILDKNASRLEEKIPIYSLQEEFPKADLIVVTVDYFYQVKERVRELGYDTKVLCLTDIIELMVGYADEIYD